MKILIILAVFGLMACATHVPMVEQHLETTMPREHLEPALQKAAVLLKADLVKTDSMQYVFQKTYHRFIRDYTINLTLNVMERDSTLLLSTVGDTYYEGTEIKNSGIFQNLYSYVINDVVDQESYFLQKKAKYSERVTPNNKVLGSILTLINPGVGAVYGLTHSLHPDPDAMRTGILMGVLDPLLVYGALSATSERGRLLPVSALIISRALIIAVMIFPSDVVERLEDSPYYFSLEYVNNKKSNFKVLKGCTSTSNMQCEESSSGMHIEGGVAVPF
ncbi:MAG: hypothetical protein OCD76_08905 [Reichenbachiella sp.]